MQKKIREVNRPARLGEPVKIVKIDRDIRIEGKTYNYYVGQKLVNASFDTGNSPYRTLRNPINLDLVIGVLHEEYVVLEEYDSYSLEDLELLMVVILRSGAVGIISQTTEEKCVFWIEGTQNFCLPLNKYTSSMLCSMSSKWDIVHIYSLSDVIHTSIALSTTDRTLLWSRDRDYDLQAELEELERDKMEIDKRLEKLNKELSIK